MWAIATIKFRKTRPMYRACTRDCFFQLDRPWDVRGLLCPARTVQVLVFDSGLKFEKLANVSPLNVVKICGLAINANPVNFVFVWVPVTGIR